MFLKVSNSFTLFLTSLRPLFFLLYGTSKISSIYFGLGCQSYLRRFGVGGMEVGEGRGGKKLWIGILGDFICSKQLFFIKPALLNNQLCKWRQFMLLAIFLAIPLHDTDIEQD